MQRILRIACIVAALALSAGAGFWFGLREGWSLALMADSAHIGFVAVPRLVALQTGRGAELNRALELDVDNGLMWSHHFLGSPLHGYLEPVWGINGYPNDTQELARLASYRKTHPSPTKLNSFDDVRPQSAAQDSAGQSLAASLQERALVINEMVERYATKR